MNSSNRPIPTSPQSKDRKAPESQVIVVVDDEADIRKSVVQLLEMKGHMALGCADGQEALLIVEQNPIFLIISDWMMPKMNGVDFVKALRKGNQREVPFVLMSGAVSREQLLEALKHDVDAVLLKPFDWSTLEKKMTEARATRAKKLAGVK